MVLIHQGYVVGLGLDMASQHSMQRENTWVLASSLSWSVKEC